MLPTSGPRAAASAATFEHLLTTVIGWFADAAPEELEPIIGRALAELCRSFELATAGILHLSPKRSLLSVRIEAAVRPAGSLRDLTDAWSELERRRLRDRLLLTSPVLLDPDDPEPAQERLCSELSARSFGCTLCTRLELAGVPVAVLILVAPRGGDFNPALLSRLRLLADTLVVALARRDGSLALREAEARFDKLIESSPDAVAVTDEENRVVDWTLNCERLTGLPRGAAAGQDLGAVLVPESRRGEYRTWLAHALTGSAEAGVTFELDLPAPGGEKRLELSVVPLIRRGAMAHAFFVRDRTALYRLERQRADTSASEPRPEPIAASIVGRGAALRKALSVASAVAETTATVLICGESGVGKELFARAIHAQSQRAAGPLVKVNCASIPHGLFESEFFGHVRGSFTGANRDRVGRFEMADGGTLFLDEVGELPFELQGKLLRVLQEGEIERVGEGRTRRVDVRVVAATNRDLREEVRRGMFRADLFFRLNVFPIEVPPLRKRTEDIAALARHFIARYSSENNRRGLELSPRQQALLERYDWPGNVRELANVIERAVILSAAPPLRLELALGVPSQPPPAPSAAPAPTGCAPARLLSDAEVREFERNNLLAVLESCQWRLQGDRGAAQVLGLSPSTLRDRMRSFKIQRPR